MGKKKFFAAAFAAFVLWAIVILQTVLTRWYVSQTAFEQAFAKSDIMKASTQEAAADTRNINSDNRVMEGVHRSSKQWWTNFFVSLAVEK